MTMGKTAEIVPFQKGSDGLSMFAGPENNEYFYDDFHQKNRYLCFPIRNRGKNINTVLYDPKTGNTKQLHTDKYGMISKELARENGFFGEAHQVVYSRERNFFYTYENMGGALCYRFWFEFANCRKKKDGTYDCRYYAPLESFRIFFKGSECYHESRNGKVSPCKPGALLKTLQKKWVGVTTEKARKERGEYPKTLDIPYAESLPLYNLDNLLYFITQFWTYASRKQHFYSNVPAAIREDLKKELTGEDARIRSGTFCLNVPSDDVRIYVNETRSFIFCRNMITNEWYSGNIASKKLVQKVYTTSFTKQEVSFMEKTAMKKLLPMFRPTDGKTYVFDKRLACDTLKDIEYALRYTAVEQAMKSDYPIYPQDIKYSIEELGLRPNASISELIGVPGKVLNVMTGVQHMINCRKLREAYHDIRMKESFPDRYIRAFVSAYIASDWSNIDESIDDVCSVAKTIRSLLKGIKDKTQEEKCALIDRLRILKDYLVMRKIVMSSIKEDTFLLQDRPYIPQLPLGFKPSRLDFYHREAMNARDIVSMCRNQEAMEKADASIKLQKKKDAENVEYTNGTYSILLPEGVLDIIEEGNSLHHCVGRAGYIEKMAAGRCRILFLRKNSDIGKRLLTLEDANNAIVQCYGDHDSYNSDEDVAKFIENYASHRGIRITATIRKPSNRTQYFPDFAGELPFF